MLGNLTISKQMNGQVQKHYKLHRARKGRSNRTGISVFQVPWTGNLHITSLNMGIRRDFHGCTPTLFYVATIRMSSGEGQSWLRTTVSVWADRIQKVGREGWEKLFTERSGRL